MDSNPGSVVVCSTDCATAAGRNFATETSDVENVFDTSII
jgi:hypothetical protein